MWENIYFYLTDGILTAPYEYFAGQKCYNYIPFTYHMFVCLACLFIFIFSLLRYSGNAIAKVQKRAYLKPNLLEKVAAVVGVLSLAYTTYSKFSRREGLFMTNPCHISLLVLLVLLLGDNSSDRMRWLHTVYGGSLFGAFAALVIPHLEGLDIIEIVAFFAQHVLIWPLGPLILYRRYGFKVPGWRDHLVGFGCYILYHVVFLVPVCRLTKINVNFQLCPSPEEWFISFGYHYYLIEVFNLGLIAYGIRLFTFCYCYMSIGHWTKDPRKIKSL